MNDTRKNKMAYFAGIIDGDGSFSLCKKTAVGERSPLYYPLIQLSTTNDRMIERLKNEFGGFVSSRKPYRGKDNSLRKASKSWKLERRNKCEPFLNEITDHLIVKKERAQYLSQYLSENPFVRGSVCVPSEVLRRRESAYIKMRSFNTEHPPLNFIFPKRRKMSDDPYFWNYFAGLMDTDGSFSIKREKSGYYCPVILLTMIDHRAFEYLLKNCSLGRVIQVAAKTSRNGLCYRLGLYKLADCLSFLSIIIPYLDIKKEQATILYDYCKERSGSSKITIERSDFWYEKLRSCNNGVYKSSLMDLKPLPGKLEATRRKQRKRAA